MIESGELIEPVSNYKLQVKIKVSALTSSTMQSQSAGGQIGFAQTTINVKLLETTTVAMSGNGILLSGFYQKNLSKRYDVLGRLVYNSIQATGDTPSPAICNAGTCFVNITYIDLGILFKYRLPLGQQIFWFGLGLDFLFAGDKSSNILDPSNIGMQQKLIASLGHDWELNAKSFVPLSLEYGTFIDKNSVTASQIILNAGYGFHF